LQNASLTKRRKSSLRGPEPRLQREPPGGRRPGGEDRGDSRERVVEKKGAKRRRKR
jgi:hypothetical protein